MTSRPGGGHQHDDPERQETPMETVQSADGTTIAYEITGNGPVLVTSVGLFCDRGTTAGLAAILAPEFTVVRYDRRGRGDSGDAPEYAPEREIEDLAAVIAAVGGSAMVYGHSSGAVLALEGAARGLPITKIAAYEPPYTIEGARPSKPGFAARITELIADGRHADAVVEFMTGTGMPEEQARQMTRGPWWPSMERLVPTMVYDLALVGEEVGIPKRFADIEVPTLVLDGGESDEWARTAVAEVAALVPGGTRVSVPGQNHQVADDVLAPILAEFFRG
jgi:pimeloyl-ACP methyl ester carboxylesterase